MTSSSYSFLLYLARKRSRFQSAEEIQRKDNRSGLSIGTIALISKSHSLDKNIPQTHGSDPELIAKSVRWSSFAFDLPELMGGSPNSEMDNIDHVATVSNGANLNE